MHSRNMRWLACLVAMATLAVGAASASANSLSIREDQFRATWSALRFDAEAGGNIICPVTLSGSFHNRTIAKAPNTQIGHITSAVVGTCAEGRATALVETLPWRLAYLSFIGRLPTITSVALRLIDVAFNVTTELLDCLVRTDIEEPTGGPAAVSGGQLTTITVEEGLVIDVDDPSLFCDLTGNSRFSGRGDVRTPAGSLVFISLIGGSATLEASPTSVIVEEFESSDTFTLRNTGNATATIDRVSDEGAAQFDVSGCEAARTIAASASCVYTIQVDERPLASGRVTVEYDNGAGSNRTVSVEVDIAGVDREAVLIGAPETVVVEQLEQNDIVEIRNTGGGLTATVDRVTTTTSDSERPDFTVTTTGCASRLALNEACHYLISVNSRPETSGRITVEYDDGAGGNRTLVIEVDIAGPDPGELEADPAEINIERLEANEAFVLRNISPDTAIVVDRTTVVSDDSITPEFSVTGIGCSEIYVAGASCTYIVSVNSRPEADGSYTIEYDDGAGTNRRVVVNVDITS